MRHFDFNIHAGTFLSNLLKRLNVFIEWISSNSARPLMWADQHLQTHPADKLFKMIQETKSFLEEWNVLVSTVDSTFNPQRKL